MSEQRKDRLTSCRNFLQMYENDPEFLIKLSQAMMNHDVSLTIQKANPRVRFGLALGHPRQRNFASKSRDSKPCQCLFSILEGSSIKNLSQLGKQLMLTFIMMFWIVSSKELTVFILICAHPEIGFFSITMYPPMMRHQFASFRPKKILQSFITLPIRRIWLWSTISYSQN